MGNTFPQHYPLPDTRPGGPSNHEFYPAYIIIILLASSKSVTIEIYEIKYEKNTSPYERQNAVDPTKRGLKRKRIEPAMLNFRPGAKRALPAHRAD